MIILVQIILLVCYYAIMDLLTSKTNRHTYFYGVYVGIFGGLYSGILSVIFKIYGLGIIWTLLKGLVFVAVLLFLLAMSFSGILHEWYTKQTDNEEV